MADFWTSLAAADAHLREIDEALGHARRSLDTQRTRGNGMGAVVVMKRVDDLLDKRLDTVAVLREATP